MPRNFKIPKCSIYSSLQVMSPTQQYYIADRDAAYKSYDMQFGGADLRCVISYGSFPDNLRQQRKAVFFPPELAGLEAARPFGGWSHVRCPGGGLFFHFNKVFLRFYWIFHLFKAIIDTDSTF